MSSYKKRIVYSYDAEVICQVGCATFASKLHPMAALNCCAAFGGRHLTWCINSSWEGYRCNAEYTMFQMTGAQGAYLGGGVLVKPSQVHGL